MKHKPKHNLGRVLVNAKKPNSSHRVNEPKVDMQDDNEAMAYVLGVITPYVREAMTPAQPLSESALQIAVVEHLRLTGVPGLLFFSIPNEGKRTPANGARMKAMGMLPGVADLFVKVPDDRPLFLELKRKGKLPRSDQLEFMSLAHMAGCGYRWADDIDGALAALRAYGAIRSK